jgi:hypothetical protein
MDRASLKEMLDRENVDPRSYAFDSPNPEEQYVLKETSEGWSVFYAERGLRRGEKIHSNEDEACRDLLERILRDSTTRRRE